MYQPNTAIFDSKSRITWHIQPLGSWFNYKDLQSFSNRKTSGLRNRYKAGVLLFLMKLWISSLPIWSWGELGLSEKWDEVQFEGFPWVWNNKALLRGWHGRWCYLKPLKKKGTSKSQTQRFGETKKHCQAYWAHSVSQCKNPFRNTRILDGSWWKYLSSHNPWFSEKWVPDSRICSLQIQPFSTFQELPTPLTLVALCRPRLHLAVEGLGGRAGKPPRQNEGQKAGFLGKLRKKRIQKVWGGVVASEWQPPNLLNIKPWRCRLPWNVFGQPLGVSGHHRTSCATSTCRMIRRPRNSSELAVRYSNWWYWDDPGVPPNNNPFHFRGSQESKPPGPKPLIYHSPMNSEQ